MMSNESTKVENTPGWCACLCAAVACLVGCVPEDSSVGTDVAGYGVSQDPPEYENEDEVAGILAQQIGRWKVTGTVTMADGKTAPIDYTLDCRWEKEGKSTVASHIRQIGGRQILYENRKHYDTDQGMFVLRLAEDGRQGAIFHSTYDKRSRTFHGRRVKPVPRANNSVSHEYQYVNDNQAVFQLTAKQGDEIVQQIETVYERVD